MIPGFIWSMKSCLKVNPDLNHIQLNNRMQFLGWKEIDLDFHTFQLAVSCFEAEEVGSAGPEIGYCKA